MTLFTALYYSTSELIVISTLPSKQRHNIVPFQMTILLNEQSECY